MKTYYVESGSHCWLVRAKNIGQAWVKARREVGYDNVTLVRVATKADLSWMQAMDGWMPEAEAEKAGGE